MIRQKVLIHLPRISPYQLTVGALSLTLLLGITPSHAQQRDHNPIIHESTTNKDGLDKFKKDEEKSNSNSQEVRTTSQVPSKDEPSLKSAYDKGTFTIKPITVNFGGMIFGFHTKNSRLNNYSVNTHKSVPGWAGNKIERNGTGWELEFGYFPLSNWEIFGTFGFIYEKPFKNIAVGPLYASDATPNFPQFTFNFKSKTDYTFGLGSRYYWPLQESRWSPFMGGYVNWTRQDAVKATVARYEHFSTTTASLGPVRLQGHKNIFAGNIHVGTDYQFTKMFAMTLLVGLQYTGNTPLSTTQAYGATFKYKDRRNKWVVPVLVSFKISI